MLQKVVWLSYLLSLFLFQVPHRVTAIFVPSPCCPLSLKKGCCLCWQVECNPLRWLQGLLRGELERICGSDDKKFIFFRTWEKTICSIWNRRIMIGSFHLESVLKLMNDLANVETSWGWVVQAQLLLGLILLRPLQ